MGTILVHLVRGVKCHKCVLAPILLGTGWVVLALPGIIEPLTYLELNQSGISRWINVIVLGLKHHNQIRI